MDLTGSNNVEDGSLEEEVEVGVVGVRERLENLVI